MATQAQYPTIRTFHIVVSLEFATRWTSGSSNAVTSGTLSFPGRDPAASLLSLINDDVAMKESRSAKSGSRVGHVERSARPGGEKGRPERVAISSMVKTTAFAIRCNPHILPDNAR